MEPQHRLEIRHGRPAPPAPAMPTWTPSPAESAAAWRRLLLAAPDLLLLDEPTNHLDAESVAWLERHLEEYKGTVVAVTHDRYFLDDVAGWILELDRGRGLPFKGNYYVLARAEAGAPRPRGAARGRTAAHDRARAGMGARVAKGAAHEGARPVEPIRGAAGRGARGEARPGPDPHPPPGRGSAAWWSRARTCARATATSS